MRCPYCLESNSKVLNSRPSEDRTSLRRRRECTVCGRRFTTYERVEETPVIIVKKSGLKEAFDGVKLYNGLTRACKKTKLTKRDIEKIVEEIEGVAQGRKEITSHEIGELVMAKLKKLDQVAYMRFASVYLEFTDLQQFDDELHKLQKEVQ